MSETEEKETEDQEIETFNKFLVAVRGESIIIMRPLTIPMSREDALLLAAYLVILSERRPGEFQKVLDAVGNA